MDGGSDEGVDALTLNAGCGVSVDAVFRWMRCLGGCGVSVVAVAVNGCGN